VGRLLDRLTAVVTEAQETGAVTLSEARAAAVELAACSFGDDGLALQHATYAAWRKWHVRFHPECEADNAGDAD
jgi:hypothetical protein